MCCIREREKGQPLLRAGARHVSGATSTSTPLGSEGTGQPRPPQPRRGGGGAGGVAFAPAASEVTATIMSAGTLGELSRLVRDHSGGGVYARQPLGPLHLTALFKQAAWLSSSRGVRGAGSTIHVEGAVHRVEEARLAKPVGASTVVGSSGASKTQLGGLLSVRGSTVEVLVDKAGQDERMPSASAAQPTDRNASDGSSASDEPTDKNASDGSSASAAPPTDKNAAVGLTALLDDLSERLFQQLEQMDVRGVCEVVWAMGKIRWVPMKNVGTTPVRTCLFTFCGLKYHHLG
jgi:hypothetical protein